MSLRRTMTRAAVVLAATLLATGVLASPAHAAAGDVIEKWSQQYTVQRSGEVQVEERMTYRFGNPATAHGIRRSIALRERYTLDQSKDRVFQVSDMTVTADKPVSTTVSREDASVGGNARQVSANFRVGDANRPVGEPVVTYTLRYRLDGAVISPQRGQEFYWDAIPTTSSLPPVTDVDIQVATPAGSLLKADCIAGVIGGSKGACTQIHSDGGAASFVQSGLGEGKGLTFTTIMPDGTVANDKPTLEPRADRPDPVSLWASGIGTAVTSVLALLGGWWWKRRRGTDERFLGLPPGLAPAAGEQGNVGRDNKPQIPVAFSPPRISVGEAGLLVDSSVDVRDTTATLVSLATRGGVRLAQQDGSTLVQLADPAVATEPHEQRLLAALFGGAQPGTQVDLSEQGSMADAHGEVAAALRTAVREHGYYKRLPSSLGGFRLGGCVPFALIVLFFTGGVSASVISKSLLFLAPLVPLAVVLVLVAAWGAKGQRSAMGRAVTDQIEGFRTYLATAEAEQLKFEEGEDIFSKYLPWAIMFNLADRWTKICARLVELGRIPDYQPSWYFGPWYGFGMFDGGGFGDSLATAATPAVQTTSDPGSGSGGSSWGGGFDLGGGGGGGDAGSW